MSISGIYSLNNEISKAESGLSTGAVDIEIEEFNQNNNPFDEDGKLVMPGDEIKLIPRVNNLGIECYLRTKIEYSINNEIFSTTDYIEGNYSSWTKNGEYYYYNSILSKKESVDLFNKIIVPNLSDDYKGKDIVVNIVVEAIQSKNFDGNWENVKIKKSVNRAYDIKYDGESSVIYEDNTNQHIAINDNFFNNLGNMLPGDRISETINLQNSSDSNNRYYLSIDYNNLTNEELALLQKLKLIIKKQNGEVLVESNLASQDKHSLGFYPKGKKETLVIELSLPNDTDNDFSKLFAKINWRFSYDIIENNTKSPVTKDDIDVSITLFLISAIGLLVVLLLWKKENGKIEKID